MEKKFFPPMSFDFPGYLTTFRLFLREGNGTPLQYSCLENPMDGGAWWVTVHGVARSRTRLSDFTFTFHFHALEKEMATHSSVLAWRIPGTGEPGGLQSMGWQSRTRVLHTHTHTHTHSRMSVPSTPPPPHVEAKREAAPDVLLEQLPTSPRDVCLLPEEERSPWRLGLRAALVTSRLAGLFLAETSHRPGSARCSGAWCRCSRRWCRPRGSCSHRPSRLRPPRAPSHWRSRPRRPGPSARTSGSSRLAS